MSLLKQAKPIFKSTQEIRDYLASKKVSLRFWVTMESVDTSEILIQLNNDIAEANKLLAEWESRNLNAKTKLRRVTNE